MKKHKHKRHKCKAKRRLVEHDECVCFMDEGHPGPHICRECYGTMWVTPIHHLRRKPRKQ